MWALFLLFAVGGAGAVTLEPAEADALAVVLDALYGDDYNGTRYSGQTHTLDCATSLDTAGFDCAMEPGKVTAVALGDTGLRGTIPPTIGALRSLRYLAVQFNDLSGPIPSELFALATDGELLGVALYRNRLATILTAADMENAASLSACLLGTDGGGNCVQCSAAELLASEYHPCFVGIQRSKACGPDPGLCAEPNTTTAPPSTAAASSTAVVTSTADASSTHSSTIASPASTQSGTAAATASDGDAEDVTLELALVFTCVLCTILVFMLAFLLARSRRSRPPPAVADAVPIRRHDTAGDFGTGLREVVPADAPIYAIVPELSTSRRQRRAQRMRRGYVEPDADDGNSSSSSSVVLLAAGRGHEYGEFMPVRPHYEDPDAVFVE